MSGHGEKPTEQARAGPTHFLETVEGRTCQIMKRNQLSKAHSRTGTAKGGTCQNTGGIRLSEAHSLAGDRRGRGLSGHGKNPTERGALTNWRWQREGLVRTWKASKQTSLTYWRPQMGGLVRARTETDRRRRAHILETEEVVTYQDMERNRESEVHLRSGDGRGSNLSGHGEKVTDRGALTFWRRQREGLVSTRKRTDQTRHAHFLDIAEYGTCQDT